MEDCQGQQLLVPPETSLERTLRTGKIEPLGVHSYEGLVDVVTIFDDVIDRPAHYYSNERPNNPGASALGRMMVHEAMRALGEGGIEDIASVIDAIWPSFYKHIGYSFGPFDSSSNISDDAIYDMQLGLERERAAYELLMEPRKLPGSAYESVVLRSYNGLAAKALCMIVDAPEQPVWKSELRAQFLQPDKLDFLLRSLIDLKVIEVAGSVTEYYDGVPDDTAYSPFEGWRCRTAEDSELMILARYHAKKYDEYVAVREASKA